MNVIKEFFRKTSTLGILLACSLSAFGQEAPPTVFSAKDKAVRQTPRRAKTFQGAPVNIAGTLLYSETNRMDGMYSFTTDATALTPIAIGEKYNASMGGVMAGSRYFSSYQVDWWGVVQDNYNYLFDAQTWETIKSSDEAQENTLATALAYDPVSAKVYGCFPGENGAELSTINIFSFERGSVIARVPARYVAMGFTSAGQLYAIDANSNLLKVDKNTGEATQIGNTGITLKYLTTGSIDQRTNRFFFAACNDDEKAIYEINLTTGAATYICDTPEDCEIAGMWFPAPLAADKAPAAVEGLRVTFNGADLTATVTFTSPSTLYDTTPTQGALSYTVKANGVAVASGQTQCGANVSTSITVPQAGLYTISVTTTNDTGEGPAENVRLFAGPDTPAKVRDVTLTRSGNWNTLTWTKVTTMVNDGYLDPNQMTYTVTRYPGGEVVKTGDKTGKFTEYIDQTSDGSPCYYEVKAVHMGVEGAPGKSNSFALGLLNVPFTETFESKTDFKKWLAIDLTGQNRGWDFGGTTSKDAFCYNSLTAGVPMDAWLISPGIWMERGMTYTLSFDVHSQNDGITPERIEVAMGTDAQPDGMTVTLMEPTVVNYKTAQTKTLEFTVPSNGVYYVGFHGCSDPKTYFLYLDNIAMTSQAASVAPAAPELQVIPDEKGGLSAVVNVTAPSLNTSGEPLSEITKLEVLRGADVIKTFDAPEPGANYKFLDTAPTSDDYEYKAVAYVGTDAGPQASANVFIGVDYPAAPEDAWVKDADQGKASLTWTPVSQTQKGGNLSSDLVKYNIYDKDGTLILSDVEGTSATVDIVLPEQGQAFYSWTVRAATQRGESKGGVSTQMYPAGQAYQMPVKDSFAGKKASIAWALGRDSQGEWGFAESISTPLCSAQDADGGMLVWVPDAQDAQASILSARISISQTATDPVYSFYWYGVAGSTDFIQPFVYDLSTGETTDLGQPLVMKDGTGWTKCSLSLLDYRGKDLQIGLRVVSRTFENILCIDNVSVADQKQNDLAAVNIALPPVIMAGKEFDVAVSVQNRGSQVARGYTVELMRDGEKVAESEPATLGVDKTATLTFPQIIDSGSEDVTYEALVSLDGDEDSSNDRTEIVTASITHVDLPTVSDLRAEREEGQSEVRLSWSEVTLQEGLPTNVHESFEQGEAFAINRYGEWKFIDGDGQRTYGIDGMQFPGTGEPMAYILMDGDDPIFNSTFKASDGRQYLAAFCPASGDNDDWAISPELSGAAQKVTFDARSYTTEYGQEAFEFLYSTVDAVQGDFQTLGSEFVPGQWTTYSFDLPEGARYFAVRCVSSQCFIFMIDNFHFQAKAHEGNVEVVGYNIYRDGVRLNDQAISGTLHTDTTAEHDLHLYQATVLYGHGESKRSETAAIAVTGINRLPGSANTSVTTSKGHLWINAPKGSEWSVFNTDGSLISRGQGQDSIQDTAVIPGIYLIRFSDGKTVKAIVP